MKKSMQDRNGFNRRWISILLCITFLISISLPITVVGEDSDDSWLDLIRKDHPRLFFNKDTWPSVRVRTLNQEKDWYAEMKRRVDRYPDKPASESKHDDFAYHPKDDGSYETVTVPRPTEWGPQAMETAFVYLMTGDRSYLEKTKAMLNVSVAAYNECYEKGMTVNWYSTSRVCALAAYDWLYNDLTADERQAIMKPFLKHIDDVQPGPVKRQIYRLNGSDYTTGFYGERNVVWFAGLAAYNDGIDDKMALRFLKDGYNYNQKMFEYRRQCAGDDGGLASATVGYAMGAYPWAQFNFLHTWESATGQDVASQWPHLAYFPVWIMWNWIPSDNPLEFGTGDTYHYSNELRLHQMYSHLSQIMHFYGESYPDCAAEAAFLREQLPESVRKNNWTWPVYPFLLTRIERAPIPNEPKDAGLFARHFETLGQVFMRSGTERDDTYSLFTIGSQVPSHKQHDENNFVIYKKGFLALDSGTRGRETGYQLRHYYSQTVAHNCILIHQPGEPFPGYWGLAYPGEEGKQSCGGTYRTTGGKCVAFETNRHYTYAAGDATACYREEKCELALRQYVFVMPDYFVICDRVIGTNPDYKKDWLLHTQNELTVQGQTFFADEGNGRLFCKTLYPPDAKLKKVGGPGYEFYACGRNWDVVPEVKEEWGDRALWGHWRMEVSPGAPRKEDIFLHLIQVGDRTLDEMVPSELIETEKVIGVRFESKNKHVAIEFARQGQAAGFITISSGDTVLVNWKLAEEVTPQAGLPGKTNDSR